MGKIKQIKKLRKIESQRLQEEREESRSIWLRNIIGVIVIFFVAIAIVLGKAETDNQPIAATKANIQTNRGNIAVELFPQKAPKAVENFVGLAKKGYYDNLIFHRVIENFMIQAGDPHCSDNSEQTICGTGGQSLWGKPFEDEKNELAVETGVLAMANSGENTNGSQFFIVTGPRQEQLEGKHTVFGKVIEGMGVADAISRVETDENDKPKEDIKIEKIEIVK